MNEHPDAPVSITSARTAQSADIKQRQFRYLMSMGIRTACFVLAIVTSGWLRWTLVGGALVLPYVAVVLANAADRRTYEGPASFEHDDVTQIGVGPTIIHDPDDRAG